MIQLDLDDLPGADPASLRASWQDAVRSAIRQNRGSQLREAFDGRPDCVGCKIRTVVDLYNNEDGSPHYSQLCTQCFETCEAWDKWAASLAGIHADMVRTLVPLKKNAAASIAMEDEAVFSSLPKAAGYAP